MSAPGERGRPRTGQFTQRQENTLGIIPGTKLWSPFPFAGLNMQDTPPAIDDKEFSYMENFFHIGNGYLRTAWNVGTALYTAPVGKQILPYFFWYNLGQIDYVIVFFTDGTAVQVQQSNRAVTTVSSVANTFYRSGGSLPICSQSGTQYLLIANHNTPNDYWIWDGKNLFGAGTVSPFVNINGSGYNYTSAPTITAFGGAGSGAQFSATIQQGSISNIQVTTPGSGYAVGDQVQLSFSGGGSDTSAQLTSAISGGSVTGVTVVNGGSGFTSTPVILFVGGQGAGATGIVNLTGTTIAAINVTAPGSGYFHPPTITISAPASGTTATATANVANGQVTSITLTNPGSGYTGTPAITIVPNTSDTLATGLGATAVLTPTSIASVTMASSGSNYASAPSVQVAAGANHSAYATVAMMPFGISGNAMETFNSRVWLFYPYDPGAIPTGGDFVVSAPGSLTDFATSDGGVAFVNSDRFLRKQYVAARQSNGYLYTFGDSSTNVISNIQTTGVPPTTTFTNQNVDPQVGVAWRDSVQDFGRTIIFANALGIFGLYGGSATKISAKLDVLFNNAVLPPNSTITPSSAVGTVYNVKHYFFLMTIYDTELQTYRNVMATWNERDWTLTSQSINLTYICTQEVQSLPYAWGTDGGAIYQLFAQQSSTLIKRLSTKYYGTDTLLILKDFLGMYLQAQDLSSNQAGIDISATLVTSGIAVQGFGNVEIDQETVANNLFTEATYPNMLFSQPEFFAPPPFFPVWGTGTGGLSFSTLCARLQSQSPDFAISNAMIAYMDNTAYQ